MTMTHDVSPIEALAEAEDAQIVHVSTSAAGEMARSEISAQLEAAHRYPRSIKRFLNQAQTLATYSQEIAEACIYSLPRGGKMITGPSVRLAEIIASAYGNLQIAARVLDAEDKEIVAQGAAWDMERNLRMTVEARRRIVNKYGKRYDDDMITMTGNAAASIALRNAIFRVVPRAYVDAVYEAARRVAVGDARTLEARRSDVVARLEKLGISRERVLLRLGVNGLEDIGLSEMETLIGLGTAIKEGNTSIEEAFPVAAPAPVAPEQEGKRIKMGKGKAAAETVKDEPTREPGEEG